MIEVGKSADQRFVYVNTAVQTSLSNINNVNGLNDVQIKKVFNQYNLTKHLVENSKT